MPNLKTILSSFKTKAGIAGVTSALVLAPGSVALAHGRHSNHNDGQRHYSYSNKSYHHKNHKYSQWNDSKNDSTRTCEERQERADQKVFEYKAKAQAKFDGLSAYLSNQEAFVENNDSISIERYEELKQKAEDAKTKANEVLANTQSPSIDCDKSERNDKRAIGNEVYKLYKSIERFENKVQKLSHEIAENVVIQS